MIASVSHILTSLLFALYCTWGAAAELSDPYDTKSLLPPKPALSPETGHDAPCPAHGLFQHALDLHDVVELALCNNPQTREVWASARVQAELVGVNQAAFMPGLALNAGLSRNWPTNGSSYDQRNIGLSLSYLIYDFGARSANLDSARLLLKAASYTQDSLIQSVFLSAVQAYYQSQSSLATLAAAEESETAAKASFASAQAKYLAGSATPADKYAAQTAYSQATLNRITAAGSYNIARGNLANIMGLDARQPIRLVDDAALPDVADFQRNIDALIDEARERRPDLRAAEAQVLAAQANSESARAAAMPTLSLGASSSYQGVTGNGLSRGSSLGITLTAPLFSGYASTYRIRSAEAQEEVKQAQYAKLQLQVAYDIWTAYQNLTTATQSIRATADLLKSAIQSERVARGRYDAGVGVMLDVLNAQSALANARQQQIQARLNWNVSRATLAQAMGVLDESLLQELSTATNAPKSADTEKTK